MSIFSWMLLILAPTLELAYWRTRSLEDNSSKRNAFLRIYSVLLFLFAIALGGFTDSRSTANEFRKANDQPKGVLSPVMQNIHQDNLPESRGSIARYFDSLLGFRAEMAQLSSADQEEHFVIKSGYYSNAKKEFKERLAAAKELVRQFAIEELKRREEQRES